MTIEVLIICSGRLALLHKCLDSLKVAQGRTSRRININVLLNGLSPQARQSPLYLQLRNRTEVVFQENYSAKLRPGQARNLLCTQVRGEWIFFIDDDATVAPDIFCEFEHILARNPCALVIGGPNLTADCASAFERASGAVLGSTWGTLHSRARYASVGKTRLAREEYLSSCNLFVAREILDAHKYPEHYRTAEETFFLLDILKSFPKRCLYAPSLRVDHQRRSTLAAFAQQIFGYSRGRGKLVAERGAKRPFHALPSLALICAMGLFVGGWLSIPLICYLGITLVCAARSGRLWPLTFISFVVLHLSYASGFLVGVMMEKIKKLRGRIKATTDFAQLSYVQQQKPTPLPQHPQNASDIVQAREVLYHLRNPATDHNSAERALGK